MLVALAVAVEYPIVFVVLETSKHRGPMVRVRLQHGVVRHVMVWPAVVVSVAPLEDVDTIPASAYFFMVARAPFVALFSSAVAAWYPVSTEAFCESPRYERCQWVGKSVRVNRRGPGGALLLL